MLNFNSLIYACAVHEYGPEFDSLIKIYKNKTNNSYSVSFPHKIDHTNSSIAYLAYAKIPVGAIFGAEHIKETFA